MGLETGTTIAQLNAAWPLGTDPRSQGDDHLRLIKAVVKNDAVSKAQTAAQTIAGPLTTGPLTVKHPSNTAIKLDQDGTATTSDIDTINPVSAAAQVIRLGRGSPVGNLAVQLHDPGTTNVRLTLSSAGTGKVTTGVGQFGNIYVGADPAGVASTLHISAVTGSIPTLRSGMDTGAIIRFANATGANVAQVEIAGTSAPFVNSVITREKGDFRYAPKVLLLAALQALADSAPVAELRDALIGALTAAIPDDPLPEP